MRVGRKERRQGPSSNVFILSSQLAEFVRTSRHPSSTCTHTHAKQIAIIPLSFPPSSSSSFLTTPNATTTRPPPFHTPQFFSPLSSNTACKLDLHLSDSMHKFSHPKPARALFYVCICVCFPLLSCFSHRKSRVCCVHTPFFPHQVSLLPPRLPLVHFQSSCLNFHTTPFFSPPSNHGAI